MATAAVCSYQGCHRPVFIEPRTRVIHKYCGRTHAKLDGFELKRPHGTCMTCNFVGCDLAVAFNETTGRVHDFCSLEHAQLAMQKNQWPLPARLQPSPKSLPIDQCCKLKGCYLPVFVDPRTNHTYDYCGRSHALQDANQKYSIIVSERIGFCTTTISSSSSSSSVPSSVEVCSICLDSFNNGFVLVKTLCSHVFHRRCVDQWLAINKECPICRGELNYKNGMGN